MSHIIFKSSPQNHLEEIKREESQASTAPNEQGSLQVQDGYTLEDAVDDGNLEGIKYLMEKEAKLPFHYYNNAIVWAAKNGHYEIVKYLIEYLIASKNKDLLEENRKDAPKLKISKLLHKVDNYYLKKALNEAVNNNHIKVVTYFLQQGIGKFSELLEKATKIGNMEIIRSLVEQIGEHTRIKKGAFYVATYWAVLEGHLEILKYLVEQGANVQALYMPSSISPESLLVIASRSGNVEIVKCLIRLGADVHVQQERALCEAALRGHLNVVRHLVEQGADIHAQEEYALYEAVWGGHLDVVKYLVEQGADIHAQEERALIRALMIGNMELVKYLVEQGADIYAQNEQVLKDACAKGYLAIVESLVNRCQLMHSCKS